MKKRYLYFILLVVAVSAVSIIFIRRFVGCRVEIEQYKTIDKAAVIYPDYSDVTLPANIAPLNFVIRQKGSRYFVKIYSDSSETIELCSRSGKIVIPVKPWHRLLDSNKGKNLYFDIFVEDENGVWSSFSTISNKIAVESIDNFLVYRKIAPVYSYARETAIYQRNLQNFDDISIMDGKDLANNKSGSGCVNCHSFLNNRIDRISFGVRSAAYGNSALIVSDGKAEKIKTRFGYTAWHPSGKLVVYSFNAVRQFFHSARNRVRDVVDVDSALAYYLVDKKEVRTPDKISKKDWLETFPYWSADGKYLYFSRAPLLWEDKETLPPKQYQQIKYDLVRTSYDIDTDQWGEVETLLSSKDTQLSSVLPRTSPDGRWLSLCMCQYSHWASYQPSSDLYLIDLQKAKESGKYEYRKLKVSSDESESWNCWSSNSRWLAFSSKKGNGLFTRIYLVHIDSEGNESKPLIVPQKDPEFYTHSLFTYSVPELIIEPIPVRAKTLAKLVRSSEGVSVKSPVTMATPSSDDAAGQRRYGPQH